MSKYIINNCPIFGTDYYCGEGFDRCATCADCVMKKIVELCMDVKLTYSKLDKPLTATQCTALFSRATLANEILNILQIQELNKYQL